MADLIDRQAAINALSRGSGCGNSCRRALERIPAAEPKRGKWIAVDSFSAFGGDEATWEAHGNPVAYYYCSVCKEQSYVDEFGEFILSNYCPECGAKMGGEDGTAD